MNRLALLLILFGGTFVLRLSAQATATDPPMTLQEVGDFLGDTTVSSTDLVQLLPQAVARNGISFSLDQRTLEMLLAAARKGRRTDGTTALVILQVLRSCADCRSTFFGPLTKEEVLSLVRGNAVPAHIKEQEVRLRGAKDIPKTEDTIRELLAAGASPTLVDLVVPADELEIPAPVGFQPLSIVRSSDYARHRDNGRLDLSIDVSGKVELLFVNNSLFYRTVPSADKKAPEPRFIHNSSANNSPSPANKTLPKLESWQRSEEKNGKVTKLWENGKAAMLRKGDKPPTVEFRADAVPGHHGFYIMIDESDRKQAHTHDIRVTWGKETPLPVQ